MFCQREVCQQILDSGGEYRVVVKDNQPAVKREIQHAFAQPQSFPPYAQKKVRADRRTVRTFEKSRGRIETRILTTTTLCNDHLNWPGVQQAIKLERITIRKGIEIRTIQYALTSFSRQQASTHDLLC